jgi:hypothetical protein
VALWRHVGENGCYKLMWLISVVDALALHLLGGLSAVLGITGTVFCQAPVLNYVAGSVLQGLFFF